MRGQVALREGLIFKGKDFCRFPEDLGWCQRITRYRVVLHGKYLRRQFWAKWHAKNIPDKDGYYVNVEGRGSGIISFLLTLIKLEPRVGLQVSADRLIFSERSFISENTSTTALSKITTTIYGWQNPIPEAFSTMIIVWVLAGAICGLLAESIEGVGIVMAIVVAGLGFFIGIGAAALIFYLNRALTLGVQTEGGSIMWVKMRRSVIEGIKLDVELAKEASETIDRLVVAQCVRMGDNQPPSAVPPPPHSSPPVPPLLFQATSKCCVSNARPRSPSGQKILGKMCPAQSVAI